MDLVRATVASNIRAEMARASVPQVRVAAVLGISQTAVSKRLRGVIAWRVDEVVKVAALIGVPLADLIKVTEPAA